MMGDRLKISITAPPVDGKANSYLTAIVAKEFGVAKSLVTIVSGDTGRDKTIRITDPAKWPEAFRIMPQ